MITISRKLFCILMVGLSTMAVASLCSILHLSMSQAVMLFLLTWLGVIALIEVVDFATQSDLPRGPTKQQ